MGLMADDASEEQRRDEDLVEFAAEVRQVGMDILTALEEGRFDQVKALATYLCMAATLVEQAGSETVEIDPYDLAKLKVSLHDGDSEHGDD
jgi:hypothetical protein